MNDWRCPMCDKDNRGESLVCSRCEWIVPKVFHDEHGEPCEVPLRFKVAFALICIFLFLLCLLVV